MKKVNCNMNLENIKELIRKNKHLTKNAECRELVDHFEVFIDLYRCTKENPKNEANQAELEKLKEAHVKFWSSFEKVVASMGITPELFAEYCADKNNFSEENWQQIEGLQNSAQGRSPLMNTPKQTKKMRRNNNVRV